MYLVPRYVYVGIYVPGLHPQKNKEQKAYWWNCSKKTKDVPGPKIRVCRYLCTRATSPPKKRTEGLLLMKLLKENKMKNNNLNTELKEMGVFSAVAGNQLPNQLQKRGLPDLFHLRCPSQSHQRSARGRTRLTTVTSISCRSFLRQLLYLFVFLEQFH